MIRRLCLERQPSLNLGPRLAKEPESTPTALPYHSFAPKREESQGRRRRRGERSVNGPTSLDSASEPVSFRAEKGVFMKTALVFPGQGSQTVGMGKLLADAFPIAREIFDRVDAALSQQLSKILFEGPDSELTLTANAQPALMASSIASLKVLETESGLNAREDVDFVAGHSLGEYSALCAAGSLTLEDAARLLRLRGEAMQSAVPAGEGAMSAILGLDFGVVTKIATQAASDLCLTGAICQVANDNGAGQVVISGTREAVERAMELAKLAGAKRALPLPVSAPFHCALMRPAALAMEAALQRVTIRRPRPPLVANVEASAVDDPEAIRPGLVAQVTGTVRWRESVAYMRAQGVTRFVEVGTGKVLAGLIKRIAEGAIVVSVGTPADVAAFKVAAYHQ
jgi:[acyl-carrier-protein] S-malonyltransferase